MTAGVVYMAFGKPAITEAENSMASLWRQAPAMPVLVVGDADAEARFARIKNVTTCRPPVQPFVGMDFMAGRVKPLLAQLSPFEETLYVDADTEFKSSPASVLAFLDRWDFVVAETETRSLRDSIHGPKEAQWTARAFGSEHLAYHNSGLFAWRRNERTLRLFELWGEEWQRFSGWDEQVALLRALLRSDAVYLTLPYTWNCREGNKAIFLHHRFGSRTARNARRPLPRRRPTIKLPDFVLVEYMPGQFVRCRHGQEQFMKERLSRLHQITEQRRQRASGGTKDERKTK